VTGTFKSTTYPWGKIKRQTVGLQTLCAALQCAHVQRIVDLTRNWAASRDRPKLKLCSNQTLKLIPLQCLYALLRLKHIPGDSLPQIGHSNAAVFVPTSLHQLRLLHLKRRA
jgi:hypothetical protein